MFLIDPRKIDIAFKAETLTEWDMAESTFGWHRIATTQQFKLGVVQGRVIMLIHPMVDLKTVMGPVGPQTPPKETRKPPKERGRRK